MLILMNMVKMMRAQKGSQNETYLPGSDLTQQGTETSKSREKIGMCILHTYLLVG